MISILAVSVDVSTLKNTKKIRTLGVDDFTFVTDSFVIAAPLHDESGEITLLKVPSRDQ
jgi:hypothetical protein